MPDDAPPAERPEPAPGRHDLWRVTIAHYDPAGRVTSMDYYIPDARLGLARDAESALLDAATTLFGAVRQAEEREQARRER